MTTYTHTRFLSVLGLCTAMIAAALGARAQQPASAPEVKSLTLITTADVQIGGPWFVARDKGFFPEEGFTKVDVRSVSALPTIYPQFVTGDIQVFTSAEPPMLTLSSGGVPVKVVALYSDMTGLHGVLAGANIKSAKDLEGKKVGLQKGSPAEILFDHFCRTFGCDVSKVQVLNMSAPESAAALVDGSVDAAVSWQPFLGRALEAGKSRGLHFLFVNNTSFMPGTDGQHKKVHVAWAILGVAPAFLNKNPKTVDALLRVLNKSLAFMKSNPDEAARICSKELKLSPETARSYMNAVAYGLGIDNTRVKEIQTLADELAQMKLIKKQVNFAADILDPAPLKRVEPQLVTYPGK